ncbi:MAG: S8 family peptidase, partial [bacterium]|nr:S8 family peptidase [bacterium]
MRKTTTTGRIGLVVAIMALGLGLGGSPCLANDENADGASVIVQGSDLASAAEAVRSVGGEISHELGIIDAVRAELSAEQLSRLSKAAGVKRIYGDRTVHAAGVVTAATRDDFVAASYGGNDGTANWTGDWVDSDPDYPGTLGGTIKVNDQPECPSAGTTFCVFFQANKGYSLTREVDLSAAASATLTYGYAHEKLGGLVTVLLEVSSDGGQSWAVLKSYSADIEADGSETFDLSPYLAANTQIRFRDAQDRGKKLYLDDIQVQFTYTPDTDYPTLIGADLLHAQGIDGSGVTVAVVDTGYWSSPGLDLNSNGQARLLAQYDAIADQMDPVGTDTDTFGHGTHLTSVALSSAQTSGGKYNGIAPGADLVSVKAFSNGTGTYADAIRGIGWVVANQSAYGIGVMNLSFAAAPSSHYWDDPLNQAVMAAWEAGIVVVASAGNTGPGPMTVGVPGNTPYVITVGAMSDAATPGDGSDDYLASFSSTGPTVEGFVKPEVVAPGGHMLGLMATDSTIAVLRPEYQLGGNYFTMSGTSQSAALVSGIVAL